MINETAPIGILDSGIGGLTVWKEIVSLLPNESTVYYADTANCPYGSKSYDKIVTLTRACVETLISEGVKIIVVACNSITAAAITLIRTEYPGMRFVGMEPAIKPAARLTKSGIIGILATEATLAGELYHNTANSLSPNLKIIERAGVGLVELIEQGRENSQEADDLVRKYIEPMIAQNADCLVLGCTHYPLLRESINKVSKGKLHIIDPAPAVARRVRDILKEQNIINRSEEAVRYSFLSSDANAVESIRVRALKML